MPADLAGDARRKRRIEADFHAVFSREDTRGQASEVRLQLRIGALQLGFADGLFVEAGDEQAGAEEARLPAGRQREGAGIWCLSRLGRGGRCQQQQGG